MSGMELAGVAKALSKPINDLYEHSKKRVAAKLAEMKTDENIRRIQKRLASVHKVKTIWQIDREVSLTSFYHPPKLIVDKKPIKVTSLKGLPEGSNIVIQGIVGQGKSTFLRYLCFQEAKSGISLPIFLELRQLEGATKLRDVLDEVLKSYGVPRGDEVFQYLMDSGKVTLLLDGFDEIPSKISGRIVRELDSMSSEFPNCRIVVTSRPDSGIERSANFRVYKLADLDSQDRISLIRKLVVRDAAQADEILHAIAKSEAKIDALLKTPLMVTLLVLVYKSQRVIPTQLSEFYQDLFELLLSRHDKTKPGYARERKSGASDRALQRIFEAFCFLTRRADKSVLTLKQAVDYAEQACETANVPCDASSFVEDVTKVSNLMLEEAQRFHFIHKSVQEFHAACYLNERAESVEAFYAAMISPKWNAWKQELSFLSQLDAYRYAKFFLVPDILSVFNELSVDRDTGSVSDDGLAIFFNDVRITYEVGEQQAIAFQSPYFSKSKAWNSFSMSVLPTSRNAIGTYAQAKASKQFKHPKNGREGALIGSMYDSMKVSADPTALFKLTRRIISDLHADYLRAITEIEREERTRDLMQF